MDKQQTITPQTIIAYNKVKIEREGLELEIKKLSDFLDNPKYISKEMEEAMKAQLKEMKGYHITLGYRLSIFKQENDGIEYIAYLTKGEEIIGNFNPSDFDSVAEIKNRAKQLINRIEDLGKDPRRKAIAITKIEEAQMFAVKSLFH